MSSPELIDKLFHIALKDLQDYVGNLCKMPAELSEEKVLEGPTLIADHFFVHFTFLFKEERYRFNFMFNLEWAKMAAGSIGSAESLHAVQEESVFNLVVDLNKRMALKIVESFKELDPSCALLSQMLFYHPDESIKLEIIRNIPIHYAQVNSLFGYINFSLYPVDEPQYESDQPKETE